MYNILHNFLHLLTKMCKKSLNVNSSFIAVDHTDESNSCLLIKGGEKRLGFQEFIFYLVAESLATNTSVLNTKLNIT